MNNNNLQSEEENDLNFDNLFSFIDLYFPDRHSNGPDNIQALLDELISNKITLNELKNSYDEVKEFLPSIENDLFKNIFYDKTSEWHKEGVIRMIMDLTDEKFRENRVKNQTIPDYIIKFLEKWSRLIKSK